MKLYEKKLSGRADLRKEKRRLNAELKALEQEPLLSLDDVVGEAQGLGAGLLQNIMPLAGSFSGPVIGIVSNLAGRFLNRKRSDKRHRDEEEEEGETHPNVLTSVAKEVLGNYLKWKALELSYKGISLVVKKRKKEKAERKAMENAVAEAMERRGF
ncbi:MAG: hypothetical protein KF744_07975 [Taibaiella sp.]|nr:hypothetical protein [Taibaiella sp.]